MPSNENNDSTNDHVADPYIHSLFKFEDMNGETLFKYMEVLRQRQSEHLKHLEEEYIRRKLRHEIKKNGNVKSIESLQKKDTENYKAESTAQKQKVVNHEEFAYDPQHRSLVQRNRSMSPRKEQADLKEELTTEAAKKVTVAKEFNFTPHRQYISQKKFEEYMISLKAEEERECNTKFRANPIPASSIVPKYQKMTEKRRQLAMKHREQRRAQLLAEEKPFQFQKLKLSVQEMMYL
jgi:protein FAM161A